MQIRSIYINTDIFHIGLGEELIAQIDAPQGGALHIPNFTSFGDDNNERFLGFRHIPIRIWSKSAKLISSFSAVVCGGGFDDRVNILNKNKMIYI